MRFTRAFIAAAFLLFVMAAYLYTARVPALRVATVSSDWFNAPLTLAMNDPDFRRSTPFSTLELSSGLASKVSVLTGSADVGLSALPPLLRDPEAVEKLAILGCYMRSPTVIGLAARKPDDPLAGPIGVVEGTISEVYLAKYLQERGRNYIDTRTSLNIISIRPPDGPKLLANGTITTAVLWEPHLSRAVIDGNAKPITSQSTYSVSVCLITQRAQYSAKRDSIAALIKSVRKASGELKDGSSGSEERLKALITDRNMDGFSRDNVDFSFVDNSATITERLEEEISALSTAGLLTTRPSIANLTELLAKK